MPNPLHNPLFSALILSTSLSTVSFASTNTQRIIGGEPILMGSAPSIVALLDTSRLVSSGSMATAQFCAGTVIADRWVLTAAHCVTSGGAAIAPDDLKVLANSHDLNNPSELAMDVKQIIVHEENNPTTISSDIALIELTAPTSAPVSPIALSEPVLNELVLVAGWGALQHTESEGSFDFPSTLHAVNVQALPGDICNELPTYQGRIDETMICAGFPAGEKDHCHGDSGGPLYQYDETGALQVTAVVSWAFGCALEGRPGVYSSVPHFQDWILSRISTTTESPEIDIETAGPDDSESIAEDIPTNDDGSTAVAALETDSTSAGYSSKVLLGLLLGIFCIRRLRR